MVLPAFLCFKDTWAMDRINNRNILKVLAEAGDHGISVKNLSTHVFNMSSTLFEKPDMNEVRRQVRLFLMRNTKGHDPLIEHTGQWGHYRLNTTRSETARQLMLDFTENEEEEEPKAREQQDLSLNLFD